MLLLHISTFNNASRNIQDVKHFDPVSTQVSCLKAHFKLLFFSQADLHVTVS